MFVSKQELSVEIRKVNRIEVDNVDFAVAAEDEVFEQLASDATRANHKYPRLCQFVSHRAQMMAAVEPKNERDED